MKKENIFVVLIVGVLIATAFSGCIKKEKELPHELQISSPNNNVEVFFSLEDGQPHYSVSYKDHAIVENSSLGFHFKNVSPLNGDFAVASTAWKSVDNTWKPAWGEKSKIRDHYNQLTLELRENVEPYRWLILEFRAYNEGIGFRYILPEQENLTNFEITSEDTQFHFTENYVAWWQPGSYDLNYEGIYKQTFLEGIHSKANLPITIEVDRKLYMCVMEANLVDYATMLFSPVTDEAFTFKSDLVPLPDGTKIKASTPFSTPWRVIIIGERPGELIENNDIILNLSNPCVLEDTSWIKPGKVIRVMSPITENAKTYVDFAAKHNLQYVTFNTGWYGSEFDPKSDPTTVAKGNVRKYPSGSEYIYVDIDLPYIIEYAKAHNIGIILYVNHIALEEYGLDKIFSIYKRWGIKGVKFGFVNVGSQDWNGWLHDAVRRAAKYHLVVNVHDAYRPTGLSRTYPNLLTQEGIGGDEQRRGPEHELVLPFTRFVAGAADHTLCYYSDWLKKTCAFQLAASVVFYSPLQYLFWYDTPSEYQGEPEIEFWEHVPTVWDDTRVINGKIGDYITVARRSGDEWYIGSLTDEKARVLEVPLDFLVPGKYVAYIYTDSSDVHYLENPNPVDINRVIINSFDTIIASLVPGGGQAIRITPATSEEIETFPAYELPKGEYS
jgi:alpha-glucosidase